MDQHTPHLVLNNGVAIPQLGFGTYKVDPADAVAVVREALEIGYRHVDTAQMYGNEREVGQAVRESGLPRENVFVTTKLNNNQLTCDAAMASFDRSLDELGLDFVDLFLIHWPLATVSDFVPRWKALEEIYRSGRGRDVEDPGRPAARDHRRQELAGEHHGRDRVDLHRALDVADLVVPEQRTAHDASVVDEHLRRPAVREVLLRAVHDRLRVPQVDLGPDDGGARVTGHKLGDSPGESRAVAVPHGDVRRPLAQGSFGVEAAHAAGPAGDQHPGAVHTEAHAHILLLAMLVRGSRSSCRGATPCALPGRAR